MAEFVYLNLKFYELLFLSYLFYKIRVQIQVMILSYFFLYQINILIYMENVDIRVELKYIVLVIDYIR